MLYILRKAATNSINLGSKNLKKMSHKIIVRLVKGSSHKFLEVNFSE